MRDPESKCPICNGTTRVAQRLALVMWTNRYICDRCGEFAIHDDDREQYSRTLADSLPRYELSAVLRERWIADSQQVLIHFRETIDYSSVGHYVAARAQDLVRRWPESVPERLDRSLLNLARLAEDSDGAGPWRVYDDNDIGLFFALNPDEMRYHVKCLISQDLLEARPGCHNVRLTAGGWHRVQQLRQQQPRMDSQAFVAMWFGGDDRRDEMIALYDAGIFRGVERAGYKCIRSDRDSGKKACQERVR